MAPDAAGALLFFYHNSTFIICPGIVTHVSLVTGDAWYLAACIFARNAVTCMIFVERHAHVAASLSALDSVRIPPCHARWVRWWYSDARLLRLFLSERLIVSRQISRGVVLDFIPKWKQGIVRLLNISFICWTVDDPRRKLYVLGTYFSIIILFFLICKCDCVSLLRDTTGANVTQKRSTRKHRDHFA